MKLLLFCLFFSAAAAAEPMTFEVNPGCIMESTSARCIVKNNQKEQIRCKVMISGITASGLHVGNVRDVVIEPGLYDDSSRLYLSDDAFTRVTAIAVCQTQ